jgi:hypothetical protein
MVRNGNAIVKILFALGCLVIVGYALIFLQVFTHVFDAQIQFLNTILITANNQLSKEVVSGLTVGMVILIPLLVFFPLLHKGIQKSKYFISLFRGCIAASIFFLSELLFKFLEEQNRIYFLISIGLVIIITFILIEVIVGFSSKKNEASFRTDIVASIVSGLLFSLLLKLFTLISTWKIIK